MNRLFNFAPDAIFGIGEARHFKCCVLIDTQECLCMHDITPPKLMCSQSRNFFTFWEISGNILLMVQDRNGCNRTLIGNHMWPIKLHHCLLKHSTNLLTYYTLQSHCTA